jgi:hypothetical protein
MQGRATGPAIALIPMGPLPQGLLSDLAVSLAQAFDSTCLVLATLAIPASSYDQQRGQYVG